MAMTEAVGRTEASIQFNDADFTFVADLARSRAGLVLNDTKRDMVAARLVRRARSLGLTTASAYIAMLRSPAGEGELPGLVNALTTNVTAFFREEHHFRHLKEAVLAPHRARGGGRLRIWSAACSTGEEPYSLALSLLKHVPDALRQDARILATDLDTGVLDRAREGRYSADQVRATVPDNVRRHFASCGPGRVEIGNAPRELVSFGHLNLLDPWPMAGPFDAIFCRNVMIYFDRPTKNALCRRFAGLLRPGGFLYLGHSESVQDRTLPFQPVGGTIYRRLPVDGDDL